MRGDRPVLSSEPIVPGHGPPILVIAGLVALATWLGMTLLERGYLPDDLAVLELCEEFVDESKSAGLQAMLREAQGQLCVACERHRRAFTDTDCNGVRTPDELWLDRAASRYFCKGGSDGDSGS